MPALVEDDGLEEDPAIPALAEDDGEEGAPTPMAHHAAIAMMASMNRRDIVEWFTGVLTCGDFDNDLLVYRMSRIVTRQRVVHKAETVDPAPKPLSLSRFASAATWLRRAATAMRRKYHRDSLHAQYVMPVNEAYQSQYQALVDARARAVEAIALIDAACLICDTPVPTLGVARTLMHDATTHSVYNAGTAIKMMSTVVVNCGPHQRDAFKKARNAVRDVLMLSCRGRCDIFDKEGFLRMVAEAYQRELTISEQAQIMLSYTHYREETKQPGFVSNNALHPRSRKPRNASRCSRDKNIDAAASIAPSMSACAAASPANCAIIDQYSSTADYSWSAAPQWWPGWPSAEDQVCDSEWHAFAAEPQWCGAHWVHDWELLEEQELAWAVPCSSEPPCSHTCPAQGGTASISAVAAASSSSATLTCNSAAAAAASASAACSGTSAVASSSRAATKPSTEQLPSEFHQV